MAVRLRDHQQPNNVIALHANTDREGVAQGDIVTAAAGATPEPDQLYGFDSTGLLGTVANNPLWIIQNCGGFDNAVPPQAVVHNPGRS